MNEFLHFSKEENFSFVFVLLTQHCITFYIYLSSISPFSKKPTFHIFHLLISPFLHFILQTHAFQVWPAFGIDNQVVDWNFFKLLTLFMLVNTWHFCLQYGNSCVYFKKLLSHCTWPFTSTITTHKSFKWLNLFQLIAKKKLPFLSYCFPPFIPLTLIFPVTYCHAKSCVKLQWVVPRFRILYVCCLLSFLTFCWRL